MIAIERRKPKVRHGIRAPGWRKFGVSKQEEIVMGRKLKVALLLPLIAAAGMSAPASASRIYGGYPWDVCSRWTEICYWI